MKMVIVLACAALLAGCGGLRERTYGTWLDRVGQPEPAANRLTPEQAQSLQGEIASLKAQAEALRVKLAHEPSRVQRVEYERELGAIGDRMQPLRRALRDGGFPAPAPAPGPMPST